MTGKTKYQYQKQIRELKNENNKLTQYRAFAMYLYDKLCLLEENEHYKASVIYSWFKMFGLFK